MAETKRSESRANSRFPGRTLMRNEGDRLIIEPAPPKSLLALLATLIPLDEEFPPVPDAVEL